MVGVGIVGSGYMAGTYSEAVKNYVKEGRLIAVTGGSRAPALAAEYSMDCEPTLESLVARPDVDAIVLATPPDSHLRDTLIAAAAGKHVLVEKPMAGAVAACDEMIAACEAANVRLAVVKTERYRKLTLRAKELVDEGRIGPVWMLNTMSMFPRARRERSAPQPALVLASRWRRPVHGHGFAQRRHAALDERAQRRESLRPGEHV